jgi:hypothetical protein
MEASKTSGSGKPVIQKKSRQAASFSRGLQSAKQASCGIGRLASGGQDRISEKGLTHVPRRYQRKGRGMTMLSQEGRKVMHHYGAPGGSPTSRLTTFHGRTVDFESLNIEH